MIGGNPISLQLADAIWRNDFMKVEINERETYYGVWNGITMRNNYNK